VLCFAMDTSSRMRLRLIAVTSALLLAPAAPAAAAPVLDPLKACYQSLGEAEAQRETVQLRAHGFTPLATVDALIDGQPALTGGLVDAFGDVAASVKVPYQADGERTFVVTLTERGNPANTVTATALVSDLTVALRPKQARSSRRVRFRGRGFTGAGAVYGHYLYVAPDDTRRHRRTVRLGRPQEACGVFSARRRQIPIKRPRTGLWILQVDQQRDYDPQPDSARVEVEIRVTRTFRNP
jgi:hypothetical protein